jgi:methionyl-tRNA formyltransferase
MRLVFMGTPEFAVASLQALLDADHEIAAVYTRMDTPKNRGMKLLPPPVKVLAQARDIPVFQPKNLRGEETQAQLRALAPDAVIVAAYGRLLPQAVLDVPRFGCLNVHASLLPKYRGAAPINACILNGETESGVTIMQMDAGLDTGDMLLPAALPILPDEPFGSLHDRLAKLGGETIVRALALLERGELKAVPQPKMGASYAPMIRNEDCKLSFDLPAKRVACAVRAYDPQPGAFALLGETKMKLFGASVAEDEGSLGAPGQILAVDKSGVCVACGRGAVRVAQVQGAGGKRMPADAFFRGHQSLLNEIFR